MFRPSISSKGMSATFIHRTLKSVFVLLQAQLPLTPSIDDTTTEISPRLQPVQKAAASLFTHRRSYYSSRCYPSLLVCQYWSWFVQQTQTNHQRSPGWASLTGNLEGTLWCTQLLPPVTQCFWREHRWEHRTLRMVSDTQCKVEHPLDFPW